jgi:hypothetical protein
MPFDTFFFRVAFCAVIGCGLVGLGGYAATQFDDWRRPFAIFAVVAGACMLIYAAGAVTSLWDRHML